MCERRFRSCFSEREANEKKAAPFFFVIERAVLFVQLNSASIRSDGSFEMYLFFFLDRKKKKKKTLLFVVLHVGGTWGRGGRRRLKHT